MRVKKRALSVLLLPGEWMKKSKSLYWHLFKQLEGMLSDTSCERTPHDVAPLLESRAVLNARRGLNLFKGAFNGE